MLTAICFPSLVCAARFSPDDKFSKHRVVQKKRHGVLLTQQPAQEY
jgi:rRNA maturation protein Nop10